MAKQPVYWLLVLAVVAMGCRTAKQIRDPEYARVAQAIEQARYSPVEVPVTAPSLEELAGPHPVDAYIQMAISQNPEIQAARKTMESLAHQVPVAASLPDPTLKVTAQPEPVQTAAGQQELIVSANQKFLMFGKLDTKASWAESQTNVARAELAAVELATITKVKQAYYELYYLQQTVAVTEDEQELLVEIREVANTRYKAGRTSQQDVLRADLEVSTIENDLILLRQQLISGQARLARLLHIAPQTPVLALDDLDEEQAPRDLEGLQQQAVADRPELHAQLAALQRDRNAVTLARLDYKPDLTLGLSWIDVASAGVSPVTNGRDSFLLSAGVNVPLYRKRLDSSVRSAEARVVSTARKYDSLRDGTLEEVTDLFAKARSQEKMLELFSEDILPKARQTLEVSNQAYNVGEVDFLQLIDNWRQLLRYEVNYRRLEASFRQTLAELERVVGGYSELLPETVLAAELPEEAEPEEEVEAEEETETLPLAQPDSVSDTQK